MCVGCLSLVGGHIVMTVWPRVLSADAFIAMLIRFEFILFFNSIGMLLSDVKLKVLRVAHHDLVKCVHSN